jgi:hypothetical protein
MTDTLGLIGIVKLSHFRMINTRNVGNESIVGQHQPMEWGHKYAMRLKTR